MKKQYRLTWWVPLCNGEGMTDQEDFEAESDEAAKEYRKRSCEKGKIEVSKVKLERVEQL